MDKQTLEQYRFLLANRSALNDQIAELNNGTYEYDMVKGSNPEFPYQPTTIHIEGYNIGADDKTRERINKLMDDRARIDQQILEIEQFVDDIKDPLLHTIFQRRYLDGWTQDQVGYAVHMDRSRVSRKIDNYLKNAQKARKAQHAHKEI